MKNETKILVGAIIVILLLLVGAFALSGSSPQPSATPTVTPVSVTPTVTPVPGGNTSTPTATATVIATVTATPVPSVTPTPMPESGVKLTEFGYWITYPPLGPQNWSAYKPYPTETAQNIVYFEPISQTVTVPITIQPTESQEAPQAQAIVHRDGDRSGTTNVLIQLNSENMVYADAFEGGYYIPWGPSSINPALTNNGNGTFTLRFDPDIGEQTIYIYVLGIRERFEYSVAESLFSGYVQLTIIGADSPFSYGDKSQYTLNVVGEETGPVPEVYFKDSFGHLYVEGIVPPYGYYGIKNPGVIGDNVVAYVYLEREGDLSGTTTVYFDVMNPENMASSSLTVDPYTFGVGEDEALIPIVISNQTALSIGNGQADIYILESMDYTIGTYDHFEYGLNLAV